jgi:hypothetical protein
VRDRLHVVRIRDSERHVPLRRAPLDEPRHPVQVARVGIARVQWPPPARSSISDAFDMHREVLRMGYTCRLVRWRFNCEAEG